MILLQDDSDQAPGQQDQAGQGSHAVEKGLRPVLPVSNQDQEVNQGVLSQPEEQGGLQSCFQFRLPGQAQGHHQSDDAPQQEEEDGRWVFYPIG